MDVNFTNSKERANIDSEGQVADEKSEEANVSLNPLHIILTVVGAIAVGNIIAYEAVYFTKKKKTRI